MKLIKCIDGKKRFAMRVEYMISKVDLELSAFDLIASRYDDMDDKADSEPSQFLGKLIKKDVIRNMRTLFELRGAAYWLASEGRYLPRSREAIIDVCRKEVNRLFPELIGE